MSGVAGGRVLARSKARRRVPGKQHTQPVRLFDGRATVSGISRGEQRRVYDQRKAELIPLHGIRFLVMHKSEFTVRADKITRDRTRDLATVRRFLV